MVGPKVKKINQYRKLMKQLDFYIALRGRFFPALFNTWKTQRKYELTAFLLFQLVRSYIFRNILILYFCSYLFQFLFIDKQSVENYIIAMKIKNLIISQQKFINLMKKHPKTLSLEDLTTHQHKAYTIHRPKNQWVLTYLSYQSNLQSLYDYKQNQTPKIKYFLNHLQEYEDHLFQQNMNIIQKLQSIGPKVNTKRFPQVNLAVRSKRKCHSLSEQKFKKSPPQKIYKPKKQEKIFQQNLNIIDKLQTIEKKIKCWQDKSLMKSRIIREKTQRQKRNQILQKFKEISKQMKCLKPKNIDSRVQVYSPYLTERKGRKRSETDYETNANSFLIKKTAK